MDSKWLKAILASGAVLAVAVGVGIYGVSVVQASSDPEPTGSIASSSSAAHPGFGSGTGDMQVLLAEALGISVEVLEAAQQAAFEAFIAIAVDEGRITPEQAGQILEGDGFPGRGFRGRGPGRGQFNGELPESFEPGEGRGSGPGGFWGRGPLGPRDVPQKDTNSTSNA